MTQDTFQCRVQPWLVACFGVEIARDKAERNHRFLEEALELVQSTGCTQSEAHQLVDYVFGREVGDPPQEVGGVMVTLAALCLANGMDMHEAGEVELARVWTKVEVIRAKQAAKPKHSPLPQHVAPSKSDPIGAAWMREQAAIACNVVAAEAKEYKLAEMSLGASACYEAIRAIPLPTDANLLAEAMKLPEVAALVLEASNLIEACDRLGVTGGNLDTARAALAPFTAAKETP